MKVQNQKSIRSRQGFTLVEMLGVLAIIAILISVIAVGVLSAINRSRIVATTASLKNIETGVTGYVALPNSGGTLPLTEGNGVVSQVTVTNGVATAGNNVDGTNYSIDQVLISAGFMEKPMAWRVGNDGSTAIAAAAQPKFILSRRAFDSTAGIDLSPFNRVEAATISTNTAPDVALVEDSETFGAAPQFAIDGTSPLAANRVVYVVFENVSLKDAQKLSQELNGALDNSELATAAQGQVAGRFIYGAPATGGNTVTCFYYVASF